MVYVNKMDVTGADFFLCVDQLRNRLKANAIPIALPIGKEDTFKGIVNLINMKAYIHYDELGQDVREEEIPADMIDEAKKYRTELEEHLAEIDDELMEKYLGGEEFTIDEIKAAIRKSTIANTLVPVTCGSSYKNKGVPELLDDIVDFMPSPLDIPHIKGVLEDGTEAERKSSEDEPFAALAFKIMTDPYVGRLTFFRVYSGKLEKGSYVLNASKVKKKESED